MGRVPYNRGTAHPVPVGDASIDTVYGSVRDRIGRVVRGDILRFLFDPGVGQDRIWICVIGYGDQDAPEIAGLKKDEPFLGIRRIGNRGGPRKFGGKINQPASRQQPIVRDR